MCTARSAGFLANQWKIFTHTIHDIFHLHVFQVNDTCIGVYIPCMDSVSLGCIINKMYMHVDIQHMYMNP